MIKQSKVSFVKMDASDLKYIRDSTLERVGTSKVKLSKKEGVKLLTKYWKRKEKS